MGGATVMLSFFVPGKPQGKGRARAFKMAGGRIGHYTPEKTRTYEGMIRTQAMAEMCVEPPTRRPVALDLVISYEIPKAWPKWKLTAALDGLIVPTIKPDADNVAKAVKDALNGVAWLDDCQVTMLNIQKMYSINPGVLVSVKKLSQAEAQIKKEAEL